MILKKLKLINFLSHTETEINFPERGIIAFIGENGAGKTSVIEAITYALTGQSSKGKNDKLVQWGKNYAKIELEFKKGNDEFKIEREIRLKGQRVSTYAVVYKKEKGDYRLFYQRNINKELPKLTGLTKKTFFYTTLIKQGDIEGLITLTPSKRAEIFEELLDLKIYQIIVDKIGDLRKFYEREKNSLALTITEDDKELEIKLKRLNRELNELKNQLSDKESEKNKLYKEIKSLKEALKGKEKEKNTLLELEKESLKRKERLKQLEERIEELNKKILEIEELKIKLKSLEPEIKRLREYNELKEKFNKVENLKKDIEILKEKLTDIEKNKKIVQENRETYEKYLENEKEVEKLNRELLALSKLEGQLENLENEKVKLKNKLSFYMEDAIGIAKKLQSYKNIYKTLELNPTLINQFLSNNEEDIKNIEEEIKNCISEREVVKKEGENLRKQIDKIEKLEGQCPTCLRPLEEHSKEEILKELNREIEEKRYKWKKLKEEVKKLEDNLSKLKEIKKLLEEFKTKYEKYLEINDEIKNLDNEIFKVKRALSEKNKLEEKLNECKEFLEKNRETYLEYKNAEANLSKYDEEKLKNNYKSLEKKLNSLLEDLKGIDRKELEEEISKLETVKEEFIKIQNLISEEEKIKDKIDDFNRQIQVLREDIKKISKRLINKDRLLTEIEELNRKLEDLEIKYNQLTEIITSEKIKLNSLENDIKVLKDKLKEIRDKKEKIEKLELKVKKAKKIEEILGKNGIQRILRDNLLYELPKLINETFLKFGFPFEQVKFSENFDIFLLASTKEKNDRLVNISSISGGQRVSLGLALRLALAKFLSSKSSFLILDEPTIHLDEQRKNELVNLLIKLKNDGFIKQLIIVSHDTEIEDTADTIYYIRNGKVEEVVY